jgi:hypothetical protein
MTEKATIDVFSSAPVAQSHPDLGTIFPGWNRGLDPAKLEPFFAAQRAPGVENTLHRQPVACRRDSDGFVWNDAAGDFVDPDSAPPKIKIASPAPKASKDKDTNE